MMAPWLALIFLTPLLYYGCGCIVSNADMIFRSSMQFIKTHSKGFPSAASYCYYFCCWFPQFFFVIPG